MNHDDDITARLKDISGIHVRNLTPVPLRDRAASLIQQPGAQRDDGYTPDDLDITLSRRRMRRVSSTSITTTRSFHVEDGSMDGDLTIRPGKALRGRPQLTPTTSTSSTSTVRRPRSDSHGVSFTESHATTITTGLNLLTLPPTQRDLEKIIDSRLFDTFVTLAPVVAVSASSDSAVEHTTFQGTVSSPRPQKRGAASSNNVISPRGSKFSSFKPRPERLPSISQTPIAEGSYSAPPTSLNFPSSPSPFSTKQLPASSHETPFFMSPFHVPSTNPSWTALDPEFDFAPGTNLKATAFHAVLWGCPSAPSSTSIKGKEREVLPNSGAWKSIAEWDVDLSQLQPLAPDFTSTFEELPPNTLVLTLSTTNTLYTLSPPTSSLFDSRPPSPTQQNASDGEVDVRAGFGEKRSKLRRRDSTRASAIQRRSVRETKMKEGATWEQTRRLLEYEAEVVTLKNEHLDLTHTLEALVNADGVLGQDRAIDEIVHRLELLEQQLSTTIQERESAKDTLETRRLKLQERREALQVARAIHTDEMSSIDALWSQCTTERMALSTAVAALHTRRSFLVEALSQIYPVEPLSSTDLLFSIVEVPLPIPVNPSDPAPPLSDPKLPGLNEDSVATALGFIAQVMHLLSEYMGVNIPYPIICKGSRSAICDPISMMHGPRVFPLYSKGMDTYRFEYAVFLLNKDIEMLMTEHKLQALDMRHTLPNLKNLLLTLSSGVRGEDVEALKRPPRIKVAGAPSAITLEDVQPSLSTSSSTSTVETTASTALGDIGTSTSSISTPTKATTSRKPFSFTPIISGLWARNHSRIAASVPTPLPGTPEEGPTPPPEHANGGDENANTELPSGTEGITGRDGSESETAKMPVTDTEGGDGQVSAPANGNGIGNGVAPLEKGSKGSALGKNFSDTLLRSLSLQRAGK